MPRPGITINEHDNSEYTGTSERRSPVSLVFGFSPIGSLMEPKYFTNVSAMMGEYGTPETTLEKWFMNAGTRIIQGGGTAMMTRLPYDNFQNNNIKYVRYEVEKPIHRKFVYEDEETADKYTKYDGEAVEVLNALHEIDDNINGLSRIRLASKTVEHMTQDDFDKVCYDASGLEDDSIYIFDIKKKPFRKNPFIADTEVDCLGVVPVIVTASTALYVQEKIDNNSENDKIFNLMSIPMEYDESGMVTSIDPDGLVIDSPWKDEESEESIQEIMRKIVGTFSNTIEFHHTGTFYDKKSVGDIAALNFPLIRYSSANRLERKNFSKIGVLVFETVFNEDTEKIDFKLRESFVGDICNTDRYHLPLENTINTKSKYIYMIRTVRNSSYRDLFHISHQPIVVFGMREQEMLKKINYDKSIIEPIRHVLESNYCDVDSCKIDLFVDAGISSLAHVAWEKYLDTETIDPDSDEDDPQPAYGPKGSFFFNPGAEELEPTIDRMEKCSTAWKNVVGMITSFIENKRGDGLFIADGPRCLNISRNSPISYHYNVSNMELLNRYLKYFSDVDSSYGAKFFNWILATDYFTGQNIWMPPSIIAAELICQSERGSYPWYSPAGFNRGVAYDSYAVSIKTRPYTDENDYLYMNQWNYFTENTNVGIVLEGNKTMQVKQTALDRLNVRRLCNYIKRQIRDISNMYKYEPHTAQNRMSYKMDLANMLTFIQKNAGISGFTIVCDESNNPNWSVDMNQLRCNITIVPIKAIEFIVLDLNISASGVTMREGYA